MTIFPWLPTFSLRVILGRWEVTVGSTLVGSKILTKGKCICITIEMSFKGLISVPIYVRSIEKHVRHLVWTFFWKNWFFTKKVLTFHFSLCFPYTRSISKSLLKWVPEGGPNFFQKIFWNLIFNRILFLVFWKHVHNLSKSARKAF